MSKTVRVERQEIDLDMAELEQLVREALTARGYRNFGRIEWPVDSNFGGLQGMMVPADTDVACGDGGRLEMELRDAWEGEGNSARIGFEEWVREMAENDRGVLQEAARKFISD